jgi:hypothetical protein
MFSTKGRREAAWFVIGSLAVCLAILTLYAIFTTRELTGRIRATQKSTVASVHLIRDCTEPHGKCFKRGQKSTAKAVAIDQQDHRLRGGVRRQAGGPKRDADTELRDPQARCKDQIGGNGVTDDRYERVTFRGHTVDRYTMAGAARDASAASATS